MVRKIVFNNIAYAIYLSGSQPAFTIKHILEIGQDALYTDEHDFYNAMNTSNFLSELI